MNKNSLEFSLLMSVYFKDNFNQLDQALESVLIKQSILPTEVIMVEDGPITNELDLVIKKYEEIFSNFYRLKLPVNQGLGNALNQGLQKCKYPLVARMDADDISCFDRFKKQLDYMENNLQIDVVGGSIAEFINTPNEILHYRVMPKEHMEIVSKMKYRNPMNHVTVMMRRLPLLEVGYETLLLLEDYLLWINLVGKGYKLANMHDVLVYVRTGNNFTSKRGSRLRIRGWSVLQDRMLKLKLITKFQSIMNLFAIRIFVYTPNGLKRIMYAIFLRKKKI